MGEEQKEKNHLIIIAGLPGTGKTIAAKKLVQVLKEYILIDQNELRRKQGMKKMPKNQDEILRQIDRMTAISLNNKSGVIIDSVHRYSFRRHQLYGVASGCGAEVLLIECVCSSEEAKKRMRKRPNSDGLLSDPNNTEVYDRLAASWEDVTAVDFKYAGADHVSYIQYNSEKNELEHNILQKGMKPLFEKVKKALTESPLPEAKSI